MICGVCGQELRAEVVRSWWHPVGKQVLVHPKPCAPPEDGTE